MKEEEQAMLRQQEIEIMAKLKIAMESGMKLETQSQPAIVIPNKEPPDIPEIAIGEMLASDFTGEDAIRYLARLSLANGEEEERGAVERSGERKVMEAEANGGERREEVGGVREEVRDDGVREENEGGEGMEGERDGGGREGEQRESSGESLEEDSGASMSKPGIDGMVDDGTLVAENPAKSATPEDNTHAELAKGSKQEGRGRSEAAEPRTDPSLTMEEKLAAVYKEIERDTRLVVEEAVQALNRNERPIRREGKTYVIPGPGNRRGGASAPANRPAKLTTGEKLPIDSLPVSNSELPSEAPPTDEAKLAHKVSTAEGAAENPPVEESELLADAPPTAEATPTDETTPSDKDTPTEITANATSSPDQRAPLTDAPPTKPKRPRPPKNRRMLDESRHEEIRKQFPGYRAWPTQEECDEKPLPATVVFTSTWLSVTAKGIQ